MATKLSIFDDIITKGIRQGQIPARTQQARNWYRDTASQIGKINERRFVSSDANRLTQDIKIGQMYLFQYDPKHAATLPYYDILPIIFPFESAPNGFLGMNLHYLPLQLRAKLMDALYETVNNTKYNDTTKLKISYEILKKSSASKYFEPCIKHYLNNHVKSKFMYIYPAEWDIAMFLPLARFQKASSSFVESESRRKIQEAN